MRNYMRQSVRLILGICLGLVSITTYSQYQEGIHKAKKDCLLDSLDYCSAYKLEITAYDCYSTVGIDIEVVKDDLDYFLKVAYTAKSIYVGISNAPENIKLSRNSLKNSRNLNLI
jgi:hypothetical protein